MAILQNEPEAQTYASLLEQADACLISTVSVLEASIVTFARKGQPGTQELDALLATANITAVEFDQEQAAIASQAYIRFGKGHHPAALNFGDCAAYALAASKAMPLLFKGNDFSQTDIPAAIQ